MFDAASLMPSLDVFNQVGPIEHIYRPSAKLVLDRLHQLDGKRITELVIASEHGWVTISDLGRDVSICFCTYHLEECQSGIVARHEAVAMLLPLIQCQGLPVD